jgi:hypothetical protein
MDQLIELLKQIQELAGVGIDALKGATGGGEGGPPAEGGGAPAPEDGSGPPEGSENEPPA